VSGLSLFWSLWDLEPSVVAGCAALLVLYALAVGRPFPAASALFGLGVLVLLLALVSPLDRLGDDYLLSAHMVQHDLLIWIVPPLLILGLPRRTVDRLLAPAWVARVERVLGRPALAWVIGVGVLAVWHLPALYDAAVEHETLHVIEHLSFLVSASIFWWVVFAPPERQRTPPLGLLVYLVTAGVACSLIGIVIVFAPTGLYPVYLRPDDSLRLLPVIRNQWGLDPRVDQQLAGMLMWIPGSLVYLAALMFTVARWYGAGAGRTPVATRATAKPTPIAVRSGHPQAEGGSR
jgi:cytochrome c oxidase assembly factor CtaG